MKKMFLCFLLGAQVVFACAQSPYGEFLSKSENLYLDSLDEIQDDYKEQGQYCGADLLAGKYMVSDRNYITRDLLETFADVLLGSVRYTKKFGIEPKGLITKNLTARVDYSANNYIVKGEEIKKVRSDELLPSDQFVPDGNVILRFSFDTINMSFLVTETIYSPDSPKFSGHSIVSLTSYFYKKGCIEGICRPLDYYVPSSGLQFVVIKNKLFYYMMRLEEYFKSLIKIELDKKSKK